jgi:FtsH-binding integral membrane protein
MNHDRALIDVARRATGALGLAAIALIHLLDIQSKWHETKYQFWLFVVLVVASLVGAALLLGRHTKQGWWLAVGCSATALVAYSLSRTTGLPSASDDIGNWLESLGLASLFVEGAVLLLSGYVLVEPATRTLQAPDPSTAVILDLSQASESLVAGS